MSRNIYLTQIQKYLAELAAEVEIGSANGVLNSNIYAETTVLRVLNELYDFELSNANDGTFTYPVVDLIDTENRLAIQVTSTSSSTKIKDTLKGFVENKMYESFDTLYFYILTQKSNLTGKGYDDIIGGLFEFNKDEHILEKTTIFDEIKSLKSVKKIKRLLDILEDEMSEQKVKERSSKSNSENAQESKRDFIYSNLLEISLPQSFFSASLNIVSNDIIQEAKEREWRISYKQLKNPNYITSLAIKLANDKDNRCKDWYVWNNRLYSFRDLSTDKAFKNIIDLGTVEKDDCIDFYESDENHLGIFKHLIIRLLDEELIKVNIEKYKNLFRFKTNQYAPKEEKYTWKRTTKTATRVIVKEIKNKEKTHIISFRHLAMEVGIHTFNNKWYLSISPTYSFSSAMNIYKDSAYKKFYLKGIKQMEKNKSVFLDFAFFSYVLSNYEDFDFISFNKIEPFEIPFLVKNQDD